MQSPPILDDEKERNKVLESYKLLDTLPEEAYDDITFLASNICNTPFALISLISENRQWFKSNRGLDVMQTPREISFCGHAITGSELFEVENTLQDNRFHDNPLVTGTPNIRFYAGVPLVNNEGFKLGTLCVLDVVPRKLLPEQRLALEKLGRQVITNIEYRKTENNIAQMSTILEDTGELAKIGGWVLDLDTMQLLLTKEVYRIYELDEHNRLTVEDAISFYAPEAQLSIREAVDSAIKTGAPWDLELPFETAKFNKIWVRAQGYIVAEKGQSKKLKGTLQDITERKSNEDKIASLNRALQMRSVLSELIIHATEESDLLNKTCKLAVEVGGYCSAWIGFSEKDDLKTINPVAVFGIGSAFLKKIPVSWADDREEGLGLAGRTIRNAAINICEDFSQDALLKPWVAISNQLGIKGAVSLPLLRHNEAFGLLYLSINQVRSLSAEEIKLLKALSDDLAFGILSLRTKNAKAYTQAEILHLAFHDALTQLPNRQLLIDRLKNAISSMLRHQKRGALLYIDLDNFKTLNDTLGHDVGDLLLREVGRRLLSCVRDIDTIARLGGDEFVVMVLEISIDLVESANQAKLIADKILASLTAPYELGSHIFHSTPSIGITILSLESINVETVLKQADLAMYQAKAEGGNLIRFYDMEMQKAIVNRVALEADLRHALIHEEFVLYYQPQINHEHEVIGTEALIRWNHSKRGLVPPLEFIPFAEEARLIIPIGRWVLDAACKQLVKWVHNPLMKNLTVAINVSLQQFQQSDFVQQVLEVLQLTGANPQRLKIELTESMLVENIEDIIGKMSALKSHGIQFSLDDFGTGYSSLSYLKRLPLDQLKIDQSFVRDIMTDPNDASIASTIIVLANNLGLSVIAEGVETVEQQKFLMLNKCLAYQGYLYSKPLPIDLFESFVCCNSSNLI